MEPRGLGAPAAAPAAGLAAGPGAPARMAEGETASPEEQALYNNFVSLALMHLHSEGMADRIAEQVRQGDPVEQIGRIAASIGMTVMRKAEEQGQAIPPDILLHGGAEIVSQVGEVAQAAGVQVGKQDLENALYVAADAVQSLMPGLISPEDAQAGIGELGQMQAEGFAFDDEEDIA